MKRSPSGSRDGVNRPRRSFPFLQNYAYAAKLCGAGRKLAVAKTLLMIHGVGCGGEVWDRMKRDFAMAGWTCETPTLFPDLRTKEDPPAGLADLTLSDYVSAAAAMADEIKAKTGEAPVLLMSLTL